MASPASRRLNLRTSCDREHGNIDYGNNDLAFGP
jgi:hypothetical protein